MPSSPMSHDGVPSQSLPFPPEAELSSAEQSPCLVSLSRRREGKLRITPVLVASQSSGHECQLSCLGEGRPNREAGRGWLGSGLSALTGPATGPLHPGWQGRSSIKINFWHLVREGFVTS